MRGGKEVQRGTYHFSLIVIAERTIVLILVDKNFDLGAHNIIQFKHLLRVADGTRGGLGGSPGRGAVRSRCTALHRVHDKEK